MRTAVRFATLAAIAAVSAATNLPNFPLDWTAIVTSSVVVNQGGSVNPDGSVCCGPYARECKVQTGYQAGRQLFDFTGNRTAFLNPDNSGVITLVNELKQYAVNASGYCQNYCPIPRDQAGEFLAPLGFPSNTKDMGPTVYKGQKVEQYQWRQAPLFNITFETTNFYVDISNFSSPVPVYLHDKLTPFGMSIGSQSQSWHQFVPGRPNPNRFVVRGKATCPISPNCERSNDDRQQDDFLPPSQQSSDKIARLHRFAGVKDVDFVIAHLQKASKVEALEQAMKKALPKAADPNAVLEYYESKLPEEHRRLVEAMA